MTAAAASQRRTPAVDYFQTATQPDFESFCAPAPAQRYCISKCVCVRALVFVRFQCEVLLTTLQIINIQLARTNACFGPHRSLRMPTPSTSFFSCCHPQTLFAPTLPSTNTVAHLNIDVSLSLSLCASVPHRLSLTHSLSVCLSLSLSRARARSLSPFRRNIVTRIVPQHELALRARTVNILSPPSPQSLSKR
jgi:hypothetical protein